MDTIATHKIIHFDDSEFTLDIDSETAEQIRITSQNEITAMHLIQSGDTDNLEKFFSDSDSDIILGYSNTQYGNERAFIQRVLTVASVAAINGGVDCTTVYAIIFKYQNIIESLDDREQIISLTYKILKQFCQTVAFQNYGKCESPVLQPVLRFIHSSLNTKITVQSVALKMNMNTNYLSRLFKNEIGERFSDYVLKRKIALAKHFMETTDKPISEISEYLAFSSPSHFNNAFKKITGTTPRQYLLKVKKI